MGLVQALGQKVLGIKEVSVLGKLSCCRVSNRNPGDHSSTVQEWPRNRSALEM